MEGKNGHKVQSQPLSVDRLDKQIASVSTIHSDVTSYQASLQSACFNSITPHEMSQIVEKQKKKALEGDVAAAKFMMNLVGMSRPVKIVNQTNILTDVEGAARITRGRS